MRGNFWTDAEDAKLTVARDLGMTWQQIADTYFPDRTWPACHQRHKFLARKSPDRPASPLLGDVTMTYEAAQRSSARLVSAQIAANQVFPVPMAAWIARHGEPRIAA